MKVDRSKVKKGTSEVPADCRKVIKYLRDCSEEELIKELEQINIWYFGKCELYHWIDVLDRFNEILSVIATPVKGYKWLFEYDLLSEEKQRAEEYKIVDLIHNVLKFTTLLIEHSYARHLYSSIEWLINLLDCSDGSVILSVLNLIYVFSKRSNYISRMPADKRKALQDRLIHLSESWGGSSAGYGLDTCCLPDMTHDDGGSLYFEYYTEEPCDGADKEAGTVNKLHSITLKDLHKISSKPGDIMNNLLKTHKIPEQFQISLLYRIRLVHAMKSQHTRLQFVQARLQSLSILVYSNAMEHLNALVYDGFIEEIVNTLELDDPENTLSDVKAACLKTLTAVIHLDKNPRLQSIIETTGAGSYHGFLPTLVRACITQMTDGSGRSFPQQFSTALFSFLYHLASYEAGCSALVASGLIESLLKVVQWPGEEEHITFVTRAVRVIDLITNLDMASLQTHNGLQVLIRRLEREVITNQPKPPIESAPIKDGESSSGQGDVAMEDRSVVQTTITVGSIEIPNCQCLPQRAALLKSILNFLKKAIPDPAFADSARSLMDESLQNSLKAIISSAEYYGALLFLLATDVVTVFVFHEPSMLSSLQESGLTTVVLDSLIKKDVPATRENLASLPNTLSALCLNSRGLEAFIACKPFERLFKILISKDYLSAMKRRRSSDPQGDTAMHLGSAMDELMRHQPTLKPEAMKAIIKLLEELCLIGKNRAFIGYHPYEKLNGNKINETPVLQSSSNDDLTSDEEMDDEFKSVVTTEKEKLKEEEEEEIITDGDAEFVPILEYMFNVMKFLENILSNNGTDDHCIEFVTLGGLKPLLGLLDLDICPLEFPMLPACQSVASVCKSVVLLSQEVKVFEESLSQLNVLLEKLEPLYQPSERKGSLLLAELSTTVKQSVVSYGPSETPLLHAMTSAHSFVSVFIFICRGAQTDVKSMSTNQWGSEIGLSVLKKLGYLYTSLVWESSLLLSLCSLPNNENLKTANDSLFMANIVNLLDSNQDDIIRTDNEASTSSSKQPFSPLKKTQRNLFKWLLSASSHLGRSLAELFGLLVHQCVGSSSRLRRHFQSSSLPVLPSMQARNVASHLQNLLVHGLTFSCPTSITRPRIKLTFYICAVGFVAPIVFYEKKPYHFMLQHLMNGNALNEIFKLLQWALDLYDVTLNDSTSQKEEGFGEFLDVWLSLVEKLANTKQIVESPHALPARSSIPEFTPFVPYKFVSRVHKLAFESLSCLWNHPILKQVTNQVADRMFTILIHIVKGEALIEANLKKSVATMTPAATVTATATSGTSTAEQSTAPTTATSQTQNGSRSSGWTPVNQRLLHQLVSIGFEEPLAQEALLHSRNNLQRAAEYALNRGGTGSSTGVLAAASDAAPTDAMDVDLSEEDMMIKAIAMSLGDAASSKMDCSTPLPQPTANIAQDEDNWILPNEVLTNFTDNAIDGCLELLADKPQCVHSVCSFINALSERNGAEWNKKVIETIIKGIKHEADILLIKLKENPEVLMKSLDTPLTSSESELFATKLHLFALLAQDYSGDCAVSIDKSSLCDSLLALLNAYCEWTTTLKMNSKSIKTPRWLASLLLLIEQYQKAAMCWQRTKNEDCSHVWKWFDDRSGRWCNYSICNNTSIDTAYHKNQSNVRFTAGRRHYTVMFNIMVQINEDTGNRRPVMLDVLVNDKSAEGVEKDAQKVDDATADVPMDTSYSVLSPNALVNGFTLEHQKSILRMCAKLIALPVDTMALNSILLLSLRLTRDFSLATIFAESGGVSSLLSLSDQSSFPDLLPLATLLLRHLIEDEQVLNYTMERVVRSTATKGIGSPMSGVGQNSIGAKELHYILRSLGPAACRAPELFLQNVDSALRIQLPPQFRRGTTTDSELTIPPNAPQLVKVVHTKTTPVPPKSIAMSHLVSSLLDSLVECHVNDKNKEKDNVTQTKIKGTADVDVATKTVEPTPTTTANVTNSSVATQQVTLARRLIGEPLDNEEALDTNQSSDFASLPKEDSETNDTSKKSNSSSTDKTDATTTKTVFEKDVILQLLAELCKSFPSVCPIITEHRTTSPVLIDTKLEDCTLAIILDCLMPAFREEASGSANVSQLSRMVVCSLGCFHYCTNTQQIVIKEIKASLERATGLPESRSKHCRLQSIAALLMMIVESASPYAMSSDVFTPSRTFIRSLIKRGILVDLARVPHSLDLSSPYLVSTLNSIMKPLERLSNFANQQTVVNATGKTDSNKRDTQRDILATPPPQENRSQATLSQMNGSDAVDDLSQDTQEEDDFNNGNTQSGNANRTSEQQLEQLEHLVENILNHDSVPTSTSDGVAMQDTEERILETLVEDILGRDNGNGNENTNSDHAIGQRMLIQSNQDDDTSSSSSSTSDSSDNEMSFRDDDDHDDGDDDDDDDDEEDNDNSAGENDHQSDVEEDILGMPLIQNHATNNRDGEDPVIIEFDATNRRDVFDDTFDDSVVDQTQHVDAVNNLQNDLSNLNDTFVLDEDQLDETAQDEDEIEEDEDDDDEEDEDENDVDGSEMDADDRMETAEESINFFDDDDNEGALRFAVVDDQGNAGQRRRYAVHYPTPQVIDTTTDGSSNVRQTMFQHPLLANNNSGTDTNDPRLLRVRSRRGDGFAQRLTQMHTLHLRPAQHSDYAEIRILSRNAEEGNRDGSFLDVFGDSRDWFGGPLSNVPSALTRWCIESQILDGMMVQDCVNAIKPKIIKKLLKLQQDEMQQRREEKAKQTANDKSKTTTSKQTPPSSEKQNSNETPNETSEDTANASSLSADQLMRNTPNVVTMNSVPHVTISSVPGEDTHTVDSHPPSASVSSATSSTTTTTSAMFNTVPTASTLVTTSTTSSNPTSVIGTDRHCNNDDDSRSVFPTPPAQLFGTPSSTPSQDNNSESMAADLVAAIMSQLSTASGWSAMTTSELTLAINETFTPRVVNSNQTSSTATTSSLDNPVTELPPVSSTTSTAIVASSASSSDSETSLREPLLPDFSHIRRANLVSANLVVPTTSTETDATPTTSSSNVTPDDSIQVPDGVDPSFLAALPANIREEVMREQLGIRPRSTAAPTQGASTSSSGITEVSPEFLAALPADVQEEVLEMQRMEQARLQTQQQPPEQPVDPAAFVRNLDPSLRRQVLADMDDTVLALLPSDLNSEALGLRRELESRQQQYFQDRSLLTRGDAAASLFSQLIRPSGFTSRRLTSNGGLQFSQIAHLLPSSRGTNDQSSRQNGDSNFKKGGAKQLLDRDSLTCLLVLLFLDEPKLNLTRLYRVFRNLCCHNKTRAWVINSLISILRKTSVHYRDHTAAPGASNDSPSTSNSNWLSRCLDSSLGSRVNLFQIQQGSGKYSASNRNGLVTLHPHALNFVCKHTLDALAFLAKCFPLSFAPSNDRQDTKETDDTTKKTSTNIGTKQTRQDVSPAVSISPEKRDEIWDILVKLNSSAPGQKGRPLPVVMDELAEADSPTSFNASPLGQVLAMLSHPVIQRSTSLADKLLRLLAVISMSLPEVSSTLNKQSTMEYNDIDNAHGSIPGPSSSQAVTFSNVDTVVNNSEVFAEDIYRANHDSDVAGAMSESGSVASSLIVERSPVRVDDANMSYSGPRSPHAESVVSSFSDGTVAHSDSGAPHGDGQFAEPMEVDQSLPPNSDTSSTGTRASPDHGSISNQSDHDHLLSNESVVLESQLRLAANVLTSGVCSEDGLEDATTLLLQLSRVHPHTRIIVLSLLMEGAVDLASALCTEIKTLLSELRAYNSSKGKINVKDNRQKLLKRYGNVVVHQQPGRSQPWRGRGGRFASHLQGHITSAIMGGSRGNNRASAAPKTVIYDLHLPSMAVLTSKRCNQSLLLRVLKVILELRATTKNIKKRDNLSQARSSRGGRLRQNLHGNYDGLREVVAALEADVEAMYEIIDRFDSGSQSQSDRRQVADATGAANAIAGNIAAISADAQQEANAAEDATQSTSSQQQEQDPSVPGLVRVPETGDNTSTKAEEPLQGPPLPPLSSLLMLDELWDVLGECLTELAETSDPNAVLVLQQGVEAFFLVHGGEKDAVGLKRRSSTTLDSQASLSALNIAPQSPPPPSPGGMSLSPSRTTSISSFSPDLPLDTQKFLRFAETHRTVLNQILRQSNSNLGDGPFSVLVNYTRVLDFDVKRRYFRQELEKMDKGVRREDMAVHIRRDHVFEDSYRELHRRSSEEIKNRLYIVFDGEDGQDAGGLLREWYMIVAREIFNPNYALFSTSQGEKATYLPNRNSHCNPNHLSYFKFVGRIVAKAIFDNKLLDTYFTRSFYKHILGKPVHFTDMEAEDYSFYQGLVYLLENHIDSLGYELTFSVEVPVFGLNEVHDLKPDGRNVLVTEAMKREYVKLVCQEKMTGSIRQQIDSFLEGFYEIIPKRLIAIFDEQELELLIAGLPTIDIEDLKINTEYHKYDKNSLQIQWFWRALRSFEQADRAKFLQFVTGTSKVPLQGFSALEGMNGPQKFQIHRDDRATDRLPSAHTCFNQLDLPAYETYDKLHAMLLKAIQECPEGFGLA